MAILKDGTVPATLEEVFRSGVDGDTFQTNVFNYDKVTITKISLFNKIITQQTIILYVRQKFGELRKLRQYVLKKDESVDYLEHGEVLPLLAGDVILAETTTDDAVDFVVYGNIS